MWGAMEAERLRFAAQLTITRPSRRGVNPGASLSTRGSASGSVQPGFLVLSRFPSVQGRKHNGFVQLETFELGAQSLAFAFFKCRRADEHIALLAFETQSEPQEW